MKTIDLIQLIEDRRLDKKEIAVLLFPQNAHPEQALRRVLEGVSLLNSDQISRLSLAAKIPINYLFTGEGWKGTSKGKTHVITSGRFRAEVDMEAGTVAVFDKDTLFHSENLISRNIPLSELVTGINNQILNYAKHRS